LRIETWKAAAADAAIVNTQEDGMNRTRGVFGMLAFAVVLALAGCRIHQPSEVDVRTDSPEAAAQDY